VSNAGIRALFNLDDYDTADYWSKTMGHRLVEGVSQTQDVYGLTSGQTVNEQIRALMPPEEIMLAFAKDAMLVLPQGAHPVITRRVGYFEDNELTGRWDDPRLPVPEVAPPTPAPVAA